MPQVSPLHFGLPEAVPSRQTSLEELSRDQPELRRGERHLLSAGPCYCPHRSLCKSVVSSPQISPDLPVSPLSLAPWRRATRAAKRRGSSKSAPAGRRQGGEGGGGFREASSTAPPRRGTRAAPTERWQAPQSRPSTARRAGCLRAAYAAVSRRGCGGTGASPRTAAPAPPRYWVCPSSTPPAAAHVARQVAAAAHPMSLKAGEESAPPDGGGVAPPPAE